MHKNLAWMVSQTSLGCFPLGAKSVRNSYCNSLPTRPPLSISPVSARWSPGWGGEEEEGPTYGCYPAVASVWARKRGGPSVTPPHRLIDMHPPAVPLGLGGHHCATGDDVWTAYSYRVSTDITWGPRAEQSNTDASPMLSVMIAGGMICHRGNCAGMKPGVWQITLNGPRYRCTAVTR